MSANSAAQVVEESATGAGVMAAFVDSGWDRSRNDARVQGGIAIVDPSDDFGVREHLDDRDRHGHGSTCIRLFLERAPNARAVPVRVFGDRLETSPVVIEHAIEWCVTHGIKLVNLSLGRRMVEARDRLYRVCHAANQAGTIVVAAARAASFPSAFDVVLSVGVSARPQTSEYEYHPDAIVEVIVRAGHQTPEGRVIRQSSYAAPLVTAIIARLLEREPNLTLDDVRLRLAQGKPSRARRSG